MSTKAWRDANVEKIREYSRNWHEANRERTREHKLEYNLEWAKANPEKKREAVQRYRETHREQLHAAKRLCKEFVDQQKVGKTCARCHTEANPRKLLFHHADPATKCFNVSSPGGRSIESIIDEIAKCEIICKRCHNLHHRPGRGNKKCKTA